MKLHAREAPDLGSLSHWIVSNCHPCATGCFKKLQKKARGLLSRLWTAYKKKEGACEGSKMSEETRSANKAALITFMDGAVTLSSDQHSQLEPEVG